MRTLIFSAGVALAMTAMPTAAYAEGGNGYVEGRGGLAAGSGTTTETIGLAVGYDFDLGSEMFLGAELVADTDSSFDDPIYGANARLGIRTGKSGKVFGTLGYARANYAGIIYIPGVVVGVPYTGSFDDIAVGAGYQQDIGGRSYISLQYQHYFDTGIDRASIGVGTKF